MADDLNNSTALTSSDDSIRSALMAAVAEHEKGAEAPAEPAPKQAAEASAEAAESNAAETSSEGQASETETGEQEEGAGKTAEAKAGEEKQAASGTEPPANWKASDKELFKGLPADAQKFLLTRYKEMEAGFTKKTQEIAEFRREYDPVNKMLEPYREQMKNGGWTPHKLIEAWANAEKGLMQGGDSAESIVAGVIKHYQVNMGNVARKLGLRPRPPAANGSGAAQPGEPEHQPAGLSPDDPIVRQLQSIQARLEADDRARMDAARRQQTTAETRVMSEIDQFKSAVDDKGNLLHPHFDEIEDMMTQLAQSANAAGKPRSLKDLYETAVWANTSTREATLAAQQRAQQEKAAEEARAKAAKARKAGSSVTGAPGTGQAPNGAINVNRSLRDEISAAYDQHAEGRI